MIAQVVVSPFSYDTARKQVHRQLTQFAVELRQAAEQGKPWLLRLRANHHAQYIGDRGFFDGMLSRVGRLLLMASP